MAIQATTHVEQTPGVCGGKPRIAGHRIRVQDIAVWYEHLGMSADEIVAEHPEITLADVHGALSYYYDHCSEINEDIQEGNRLIAELRTRTPSKLLKRLAETGNESDSVSPG